MEYKAFLEKFNINLNIQQEEAVKRTEGATLLLAVPGSGKTTVLIAHVGYLIYCNEIPPHNILTMTYTVAAARDMKQRFLSIFGSEFSENIEFRTINGVCASVINYYARVRESDPFELVKDNAKLIYDAYRRVKNDFPSDGDIKNLQALITYAKNMQLSKTELSDFEEQMQGFSKIFEAYNKLLISQRLMDYDDQLVYAFSVLQQYPEILDHYRRKYRYLCVDEAQDTSKIQHKIIRLLASENGNLFMVGDEDQSIYGFRAAFPDALMTFEGCYQNSKVLLLEKNYRSTKHIVTAADIFIRRNGMRHEKNMVTDNEIGEEISRVELSHRKAQYDLLCEIAENCNKETAVLYRNNDSAIPILDALNRKGIGYRCRKTESTFFSHYIVRDIVDILLLSKNPCDSERFMRVYYKFNCGISRDAAQWAVNHNSGNRTLLLRVTDTGSVKEWCKEKIFDLDEGLRQLGGEKPERAITKLRYTLGYGDYLLLRNADTEKLEILTMIAAREKTIDDFLDRLSALYGVVKNGTTDCNSKLILSTIHSSKGLEYERVILADVIDGILPADVPNATAGLDEGQIKQIEEERRIFYVGVTRAKTSLAVLTYRDYKKSSLFVNEFFESGESITVTKQKIPMIGRQQIKPPSTKSAYPVKPPQQSQKANWLGKDIYKNVRVNHTNLGAGVVLGVEDGKVNIRFDNGETKKLSLNFCLDKGMLKIEK